MSYILEALKKSQQERELGHVPTLETPSFLTEETGMRPNLWILLALTLAGLAVVIALYSALRLSPQVSGEGEISTPSAQAKALETAEQDRAPPPQPPTRAVSAQAAATVSSSQPSATFPPVQTPVEPEPGATSVVLEPPRRPVPQTPPATEPPGPAEPLQPGKVPPDLVADIEAFKREVRDGKSGTIDAEEMAKKVAPQDLRLPKDVRSRLPEFIMSAHIYDQEAPKRFVLINGLKTREGEESREKIVVERILPDGAVLRFDGHRFFQPR